MEIRFCNLNKNICAPKRLCKMKFSIDCKQSQSIRLKVKTFERNVLDDINTIITDQLHTKMSIYFKKIIIRNTHGSFINKYEKNDFQESSCSYGNQQCFEHKTMHITHLIRK